MEGTSARSAESVPARSQARRRRRSSGPSRLPREHGEETPNGSTRTTAAPSGLHVLFLGADPLFVEAISPRLEALGMTVVQPGSHGTPIDDPTSPSSLVAVVDADGDTDDPLTRILEMPDAKRVWMSTKMDHVDVRVALREGFHGAISKDIPLHRFGSAILSVAQGNLVMELESPRRSTDGARDLSSIVSASLTAREREVLALLVEGATGAELAARLSLSPHTVRTHVQNVMSKLQVHSRVEAVAYAVRHRLVHPKEAKTA